VPDTPPKTSPPDGGETGSEPKKKPWGLVAKVTAVVGLVGSVLTIINASSVYATRKADKASLDSVFTKFSEASSSEKETRLSGFFTQRLPDRLEPYAIWRILTVLHDAHPRHGDCPATGIAFSAIDSLALDAVRHLQNDARRVPSAGDWFRRIVLWFAQDPVPSYPHVIVENADLRGANLGKLRLDSASFVNSCLGQASFAGVTGRGIAFDRASLRNAIFQGDTLKSASFDNADLACANLGNAVLDGASFSDADLTWTYFGGASLKNAKHWNEAKSIADAWLQDARDRPPTAPPAERAGRPTTETDMVSWIERRDQQRQPDGRCAIQRQ
jgi:uncharacterized protein YjbI with pentapeptide repeats